MEKRNLVFILGGIVLIGLVAYGLFTGPLAPKFTPAACTEQLDKAMSFLDSQYNSAVGLLRDSPQTAPNTYWLTNDNALAMHAYQIMGNATTAAKIGQAIARYGYDPVNGLIEAVWGTAVAWPPHVADQTTLLRKNGANINQEFHQSGPTFTDWEEYANLAFLGALNEFNGGHAQAAMGTWARAMRKFDGVGFLDKASSSDRYETYKVALAIYSGYTIGAPMNRYGKVLFQTLLSKQNDEGGFTSIYGRSGPRGDANTETTSFAVLALKASGCGGK